MDFGILSSPVPGHINPLCAVARALIDRGHKVTFFSIEDARGHIGSLGVNFHRIGESDFPAGAFHREWGPMSHKRGFEVVFRTVQLHKRLAAMMCRDAPGAARTAGIDAWIIDQIQFQGAAIAAVTRLPFVTFACALHVNKSTGPVIPTPFVGFPYATDPVTKLSSLISWLFFDFFSTAILNEGNRLARSHGLPVIRSIEESFSNRAILIPTITELDWPIHFRHPGITHYVGPMVSPDRDKSSWNPPPHDSRQLVYVTFGTLVNRNERILTKVLTALQTLNVHAVVALGDWQGAMSSSQLPGNPTILRYAPQKSVLKHAALCVTSGGFNTFNEALYFGVPLLVLPITNDQLGVGARVKAAGVGQTVRPNLLSIGSLRTRIKAILGETTIRANAQRIGSLMRSADGPARAASLIESSLENAK